MALKKPELDKARIRMLRGELTKVRCWATGFLAGRKGPGEFMVGIPGDDSLRQTIQFFDELLKE